ncbi:hypothetical protein AOXY_G1450 [Acipenser oxyrinchus oxyrinchus]|uniref:Uncharacterized protein n=1 Tax=Acipenser oxyrinchus oxyrinchus TaxID=40147 RepID=A0AAD8GM10_ACIOX|nr:hypothetical protein AOXY_G1450 [Acipenser oxyrinchus oxyrinchus]
MALAGLSDWFLKSLTRLFFPGSIHRPLVDLPIFPHAHSRDGAFRISHQLCCVLTSWQRAYFLTSWQRVYFLTSEYLTSEVLCEGDYVRLKSPGLL